MTPIPQTQLSEVAIPINKIFRKFFRFVLFRNTFERTHRMYVDRYLSVATLDVVVIVNIYYKREGRTSSRVGARTQISLFFVVLQSVN